MYADGSLNLNGVNINSPANFCGQVGGICAGVGEISFFYWLTYLVGKEMQELRKSKQKYDRDPAGVPSINYTPLNMSRQATPVNPGPVNPGPLLTRD